MATNAAATIPALLRLSNLREKFEKSWLRVLAGLLNFLCLAVQIFGVAIWTIIDSEKYSWILPLGLVLASFGWWESFVSEKAKVCFNSRGRQET